MTIELRIKPQGPVLEAFYKDRARCTFIRGPLGSAKTTMVCCKLIKLMTEQEPNAQGVRPSRWVVIRNTYPDLLSTTAKDWMELAGDFGRFVQSSKEPPHQNVAFELEDGTVVKAEMLFLAMDRDDHVKKLRGIQCTGFWLSEAKELPKSVVDMADLRHGRYPSLAQGGVKPTWHGMIGDTNSPDDDHWYYDMAEGQAEEGWNFYTQPGGVIRRDGEWVPNPNAENLKNLPEGYYISGMRNKSHDWIKVNLANEYGSLFDGKPVYDEFNQVLHQAEFEADPALGLVLMWDFGLTPACLIGQVTPNGQLRILYEFLAERSGIQQFGINVVRPFIWHHLKDFTVVASVGDPAGMSGADTDERTCIGILSEDYNKADPMRGGVGIPTLPASSNALERRIGAVKGFLSRLIDGEPAIVIHKRCQLLVKGFLGGYQFEKVRVSAMDRYKETPSKNKYSHPHDALQYGCMLVLEGIPDYDDYEDEWENQQGRSAVGGY